MKMDRKRRMTFIPSERLYDRFGRSAWMVYGVKKSRNYGSAHGRRHVFRLLDAKGRIKYRGFCIFPDDANYNAIVAPLVRFGCYHGCYNIAYKVRRGYQVIPIPEATLFQDLQFYVYRDPTEFLDMYDLHDLTEADAEQICHYLEYVTKP